MFKIILGFICVFTCFQGLGDSMKRMQKALEKGDLEKFEKTIIKELEKDSLHPGVYFYGSVLVLNPNFRRHSLDSAYDLASKAILLYEQYESAYLKDFESVGGGQKDLLSLKKEIERQAYNQVLAQRDKAHVQHFLSYYTEASQKPKVLFFRDSLAYEDVKLENTWEAYKGYMDQYPESVYRDEAQKHFQDLVFLDYTQDNRLASFEKFYRDYPNSPQRDYVEMMILEKKTRSNKPEDYRYFIQNYPKSRYVKRAADILLTLDVNQNTSVHPKKDSLEQMRLLNREMLIPYAEDGLFGFMKTDGLALFRPSFVEIDPSFICGQIFNHWLRVRNEAQFVLIDRKGNQMANAVTAYKELGSGVVLVKTPVGKLMHESGYVISDVEVEAAAVLPNGWIAYQKKYDWGIMSMLGQEIFSPAFASITTKGPFMIFEKEQKYAVTTVQAILDGSELKFQFDDYDVVADTLFHGFDGDREALLNGQLKEVISLAAQQIYVSDNSWYVQRDSSYMLYDFSGRQLSTTTLKDLQANDGWLAYKKDSLWTLIPLITDFATVRQEIDSIKLLTAQSAFFSKGDTALVVFQNGKREWLQPNEQILVLESQQSKKDGYIVFSSKGYQKVLDSSGLRLFESQYDELILLSDTLFRFKTKGKVGVISISGKVILPAKYDLIDEKSGLLFLLEQKVIGCYDLIHKIQLPSVYSTRIERAGSLYYQVQKTEKTGIVNQQNEEVIPIMYDQITNWNDTSFWARQGDQWFLLDHHNQTLETMKSVKPWFNAGEEQYYVMRKETGQGLYSNLRGPVLRCQYNDIVNLGTSETPLFFAEEHLKTASFFVVTYFNRLGESIKSQAYRPEAYDAVYCDQ